MQFSSLLHLLKMCKQKNISTAVETTGDVPFERIREAEPYLDLFLYDFKHLDNIRLKKVTAGNGKRIKANLLDMTYCSMTGKTNDHTASKNAAAIHKEDAK